MCLEVCVTSNVLTGAARSVATHPIHRFLDAGCNVVLGDDNPITIDTTLGREVEQLAGCGPDHGRARADPGDRDRVRVLRAVRQGGAPEQRGAAALATRRTAARAAPGRGGAGDRAVSGRSVSLHWLSVFEIGSSLREARTRQGLDFNEMEFRTKVRAKYLRALEDERFDQLPGAHLHQGLPPHLRRSLGMDGQLYVDEYNSRYVAGEEEHPLRTRRVPTQAGATASTASRGSS